MPTPTPPSEPSLREVYERVLELDERIARLEERIGSSGEEISLPSPLRAAARTGSAVTASGAAAGPGLELRVGELGLAWIGSAILLLGLIFAMSLTHSSGLRTVSILIGYSAAGGLYLFARRWRERAPHIHSITLTSCLLLFYYTTARLHFLSEDPVLTGPFLGSLLLLMVVAFELFRAVARGSQAFTTLAIILGLIAGLLIDSTAITLSVAVVMAVVAVYMATSREWNGLAMLAIPAVYLTHLVWLIGNPVAGHTVGLVQEHQNNLVFLFLYAVVFSWPALSFTDESSRDIRSIALVLFNTLGLTFIASISVLAHFDQQYAPVSLAAAAFFLMISVILWRKTGEQFAPSVYACFGYLALSVAIVGFAGIPAAFVWLAMQSLLVVSMALWFRSKIIVVANSLIYLLILLVYVATSPSVDGANISFALVALLSARIMNWQRERLTLRTELMRNVYLFVAFVFVLYALYGFVPDNFVTLSWTGAAVGYFTLSLLLKNLKYRWMSISTLLVTAVYLFVFDMPRLEPMFKVIAFLVFALITLAISFFYTSVMSGNKRRHRE